MSSPNERVFEVDKTSPLGFLKESHKNPGKSMPVYKSSLKRGLSLSQFFASYINLAASIGASTPKSQSIETNIT